jgi:hypothetical protein
MYNNNRNNQWKDSNMYSMSKRNHLQLVPIKWLGTTLCLVGIGLTSLNVYPLNLLFGLIGSALWTLAGILQQDAPLVLVELVAAVMYLLGIIIYIVNALIKWGIV